jgi:hypothetical protein
MGLDIGPKTIETYRQVIAGAKTVVWSGPMGVFEIDAFASGTVEVVRAVARVDGTTVIGGGDSIAAVAKAGVTDRIAHISTGRVASLEFLAGRTYPASRHWSKLRQPGHPSTHGPGTLTVMRIPFIAANWKMHKTVHEAVVFVKEFRSLVKDIDDVEIVVAPPSRRCMPWRRRRGTHRSGWPGRTSTGSVKPDNIHELVTQHEVDGALVGGASLDLRTFYDIVARSRQSAV